MFLCGSLGLLAFYLSCYLQDWKSLYAKAICCFQYVFLGCMIALHDYEVLFAVSIVLALIIKYLCKSKKDFLYLWLMYFWKLAVFIVMIPAVIFLTNNFYSSEESLKHCEGLIIDIQQASVGPSKTASPLRNYVKIKVDNENTSFWYDINNEPKPVGTKCILSVQKGFFGLRFVENVDFLVE